MPENRAGGWGWGWGEGGGGGGGRQAVTSQPVEGLEAGFREYTPNLQEVPPL